MVELGGLWSRIRDTERRLEVEGEEEDEEEEECRASGMFLRPRSRDVSGAVLGRASVMFRGAVLQACLRGRASE
eukprot:8804497-Pyramimonas_sp.AAC.1